MLNNRLRCNKDRVLIRKYEISFYFSLCQNSIGLLSIDTIFAIQE